MIMSFCSLADNLSAVFNQKQGVISFFKENGKMITAI